MGFLRHIATGLIYIKKSTIFANSTLMILIPSVRFIPSMVAPQQSHSPFFLTRKDSEIFNDTVQFTLPVHQLKNICRMGLVTFRMPLVTFRKGLVTFRMPLVTFRMALVTFRKGLVTFRQPLVTCRIPSFTFWRTLINLRMTYLINKNIVNI